MASFVDAMCDAEKTEHSLKLSAKNAHSYGYPIKSSSLAEYKGYIIPTPKDECYPLPFVFHLGISQEVSSLKVSTYSSIQSSQKHVQPNTAS
jgi:hypothetical protein